VTPSVVLAGSGSSGRDGPADQVQPIVRRGALPRGRPSCFVGARDNAHAVSAQNVELVRRSFEAFARGDLEGFFAGLAPDIEWTTGADEPDPQTYRGAEGMRRFTADTGEAWANRFDGAVDFGDFIDIGEWVVAPWTARLEGKGSGIVVEVYETYAVRVEGDRIARVIEYRTTDEAVEACRKRAGEEGS
jgi:ketosteroid isomerase-like protein